MPSTIQSRLAAYFPDRSPTWIDLLIAILIGVEVSPDVLSPATMSWPAAVTGFLVFSVALGPGANSSLGRRIGRWFRNIGVTGRFAVIVLFAIAAAITFRFDAVPNDLIADAATGGLLATFLYLSTYLLWTGEVSGWKRSQRKF